MIPFGVPGKKNLIPMVFPQLCSSTDLNILISALWCMLQVLKIIKAAVIQDVDGLTVECMRCKGKRYWPPCQWCSVGFQGLSPDYHPSPCSWRDQTPVGCPGHVCHRSASLRNKNNNTVMVLRFFLLTDPHILYLFLYVLRHVTLYDVMGRAVAVTE